MRKESSHTFDLSLHVEPPPPYLYHRYQDTLYKYTNITYNTSIGPCTLNENIQRQMQTFLTIKYTLNNTMINCSNVVVTKQSFFLFETLLASHNLIFWCSCPFSLNAENVTPVVDKRTELFWRIFQKDWTIGRVKPIEQFEITRLGKYLIRTGRRRVWRLRAS